MAVTQITIFLLGAVIAIDTVLSAARTFVVPRGEPVFLTRAVFIAMRSVFNFWTARVKSYEARDRIMGYYTPMSLLALPPVWLALVLIGYTGMF